eukprot:TRINITY_DN746_c0_g2_i1.p2 TRINITY_DN746_c0_g2~~TRINITY_DN746_c0_g2_i1.p2  ORF type:complete len:271 (+),score=102.10 TRINITY_DN746_c0_g2_i1:61-873(+)
MAGAAELASLPAAEVGKCPKISGEAAVAFRQGVTAVFMQWTALQLLRDQHHRAGRVAEEMEKDVVDWFLREGEVFTDELEAYLDKELSEEAQAQIEDGSCSEVAAVICRLHRECAVGCFTRVEHLRRQASSAASRAAASSVQHHVGTTWEAYDDCEVMDVAPAAAAAAPAAAPADGDDDEVVDVPALVPAAPAEAPFEPESVVQEVVAKAMANRGALASREDVLRAIRKAADQLLGEAGGGGGGGGGGGKKRRGRNAVVDHGDGWATVVR